MHRGSDGDSRGVVRAPCSRYDIQQLAGILYRITSERLNSVRSARLSAARHWTLLYLSALPQAKYAARPIFDNQTPSGSPRASGRQPSSIGTDTTRIGRQQSVNRSDPLATELRSLKARLEGEAAFDILYGSAYHRYAGVSILA